MNHYPRLFSAHDKAICDYCDKDMEEQTPTLVVGPSKNLPHWLQRCNSCGGTTQYVLDSDVSQAMEQDK